MPGGGRADDQDGRVAAGQERRHGGGAIGDLFARRSRRQPLADAGAARVRLDLPDQFDDTGAAGGDGEQHRHLPAGGCRVTRQQLQVGARALRQRRVALVHHQDVGDFEDAGLDRLHLVAQAGGADDDAGVGVAADLHLRLAGADGLDDHRVETGGIEQVDDLAGAARQSAQVSARRNGADEHRVAVVVVGHAHPVAEQGAAADRAGGIDRQHRDAPAAPQQLHQQRVDQRRLARARRAGDADDMGAAAVRQQAGVELFGAGPAVLDQADGARQRRAVLAQDGGGIDGG
ncbi:hypothetical protein GALL_536470 [mine drainage metagenome]|uniref:Uncharacterized protein n=1 Tax=mine drainage metagenome TaxID=410659 RepID=A0A1J5NZU2_9ZZZZ